MAILSRIFADKPSRKTTLILSAAGVAALAAGSWIGGGNSPTGALILFAGLVFVIPACTYRWQEIKKFRYLTSPPLKASLFLQFRITSSKPLPAARSLRVF